MLQPAAKIGLRPERILALFLLCCLLTTSGVVSAATLAGTFYDPGANLINLSEEGTLDWGHWGLVTEWTYNHKSGVPEQITYSFITVTGYPGFPGPTIDGVGYPRYGATTLFSWTDGTPTGAIDWTDGAVYMWGDILTNKAAAGFHIECLADTSPRTLRLYLGQSWAKDAFIAANLSGSALSYTDDWIDHTGLNRVYQFDFQADSPGQKLVVEYTCVDPNWYIGLQAATLAGIDAPPTTTITAPADGAAYSAPATFTVTASATDADGTVTNLSLFRGSTLLKQSASGTLTATLNNQPPGVYDFFTVATDNGGLCSTSYPVRVYVTTNGGTLAGSVDIPPYSVDLTAEGTADWAHWGLSLPGDFDRKSGVAPQIPNVGLLNASPADLNAYFDNLSAYSWSDGTPTPAAYNSTTGIALYETNAPTAGFRLTVPATNRQRRLNLYLGLLYANGRLDAWLSDFSAMPYFDTSLYQSDDNGYAVYTLTFGSANPGVNLVVTWTPVEIFNAFYAWLTWQAATLEEGPDLAPIPNQTINLGTTLTVTNTATSASPPLTFSLGPGAATGASITSDTGIFTWTPTAGQAGSNAFTIVVTDSGSPALSTTQTFGVTVVGGNSPPVLAAVPNQTIAVGMTLTITNTATDSDRPAQTLTFSLGSGAPTNAAINATTGLFTWRPTSAQIGSNPVAIIVTDSGSPPLSATQSFTVTVLASNTAPQLGPIPNQMIALGTTLTITNTATDSDRPAQTLTFSLGGGSAANAAINATTGVFTWTPTAAQIGTNTFGVVVTDNGLPPLSATQTFKVVVVVPRPVLSIATFPAVPTIRMSFRAEAGVNYTVQFTNSLSKALSNPNWPTLTNFVGTGAITQVPDPSPGDTQRFYRVVAH